MTIRLLIADDHLVVRMGLVAVLATQRDLTVIAQASDGDEAVRLHREHRPDVTLMDVRMPVRDGIAATAAIRAADPAARVLMLTTYDTEEDVHRALAAGASGYLLKDAGPEELIAAIRAVHAGERSLPEHLRRPQIRHTVLDCEVRPCLIHLQDRVLGADPIPYSLHVFSLPPPTTLGAYRLPLSNT